MEMIEVKTAELIGPALDWAVAKAEGHEPLVVPTGCAEYSVGVILAMDDGPRGFACRYSTDWALGGPLIYKHMIAFGVKRKDTILAVICDKNVTYIGGWQQGENHLTAACRAVVASKLGDIVQIPAELA